MKALTDSIIETLEDKRDGFIGSLKDKETMANSKGFREGLGWAIETIKTAERQAELEEVVKVVMKHLNNKKYNPHCKMIINSTSAELVEGKQAINRVFEYVKD